VGGLLIAVLIVVLLPSVSRADWPIYGHDYANTRDGGNQGPLAAELRDVIQTWVFRSPSGDFTGTPVVAGGTLVAGSNTGVVYALNAVTGKLLWSRSLGRQIDGSAAIDLHAPGGPVTFIPVADLGAPQLVALSLTDGSVRWRVTLTRQPGADVYGSPVFWRGTVYIGTSGNSFDVSTARGSLVALNEATGRLRWQTFTVPPGHDGGGVWGTPAIDTVAKRIYIGTGNAYHPPVADTTDSILVIDPRTGGILGHYQALTGDSFDLLNNPLGADADFGSSPNLIEGPGGQPLVGDGAKNGTYYAIDRSTLRPVWHTSIGLGSESGGILGSTAYDGSAVYGADALDGGIWSLGTDGSMRWGSLDPGVLEWAPVAIGNGVLYSVDPLGLVVARDARTGGGIEVFPLGGLSFGGVSLAGRAIYAAVGTGGLQFPGTDPSGSIIAFGDTSLSGAQPGVARHHAGGSRHKKHHRHRRQHRRGSRRR
jgi:polyvinyl alcohol dehydrogenase (cytochrome)